MDKQTITQHNKLNRSIEGLKTLEFVFRKISASEISHNVNIRYYHVEKANAKYENVYTELK